MFRLWLKQTLDARLMVLALGRNALGHKGFSCINGNGGLQQSPCGNRYVLVRERPGVRTVA
ncbi:hypothetical protein AA13594_1110 [Gluconacetobacter azotocaptans DSM 13594]|nr:hypothetical protein AA13594_1110 [Gluconacetobacter azotocaptans DSM 13594]